MRLYEGTTRVGTSETDPTTGAWTVPLADVAEGSHAYVARATDPVGNVSASSDAVTVVVDVTAPSVVVTDPPSGKTGVAVGANVTATFSEAMNAATVTTSTVKLVKAGTKTVIRSTVTYDPATKTVILDPSANLAKGTTYQATVTVGVQDLAGTALDQNPTLAGNQAKIWRFTTAR